MNEKILCIHHNDSDGRLAGAIVKYKYPTAELIEVNHHNYKEKLNLILNINNLDCFKNLYNNIYILDFSLMKNEMVYLINNFNVVWCDHHKSAMEKLKDIWVNSNILGHRSFDKCGAILTWNYFGNESFEELELVDDYDRWQHKLGEKTHWFAELNKNWSVEKWVEVISKTGTGRMQTYLEEGKKLFSMKLERIQKSITKGIPVTFKNKKAFLVNDTNIMDGALLGNTICKNGYDIAIKFSFDKDKVIFGLNSIGELDVSTIAKEYGGGGHKNASGFHLNFDEFNIFIKNLQIKL